MEPQRAPLVCAARRGTCVFRLGPEETLLPGHRGPVPCGLLVRRSVIFQPSDDTQIDFSPLAQVEQKVVPFGARCHLSKISGGFPTRENLDSTHWVLWIRIYDLYSANLNSAN